MEDASFERQMSDVRCRSGRRDSNLYQAQPGVSLRIRQRNFRPVVRFSSEQMSTGRAEGRKLGQVVLVCQDLYQQPSRRVNGLPPVQGEGRESMRTTGLFDFFLAKKGCGKKNHYDYKQSERKNIFHAILLRLLPAPHQGNRELNTNPGVFLPPSKECRQALIWKSFFFF